ncbi:MAG: hypothetical protein Q9225_005488 [Loekoesia sp. 1 TL-2023]
MGKDSLPLVFGPGKLEKMRVGSWYEDLLTHKAVYANCFVPTFTRVKNLGSKYMHEYCQFIVEDRSTSERARVYAERANEEVVDVITIGREEKSLREWNELPLPLTSISFEDKAKQPSLLDIAKVISSVNVVGGKYNFYDKNCFWFAFTTFDTSSAKGFEKERTENFNWLQPLDDRDQVTPEDFVKKLSGHLLESQSIIAYNGWAHGLGVDVSEEDLTHVISNIEAKVGNMDAKGDISWTQDFDSAVRDLTQKALSDPNTATYLAKYNQQPKTGYTDVDIDIHDTRVGASTALNAVNGEEVNNPSGSTLVPNTDANERLVKALKVVVGAVLVDAGLGK